VDRGYENTPPVCDLAGQELRILHQISQSISCTLDLDRVVRQIVDLVVDVTEGDSCLLYLLDETQDTLVLRASKIPHPHLIGRVALKVGEGITGWVAQEAKPVAIGRDAGRDERFKLFNTLPEDRYEAFLSVPIIAPSSRVVGVINVQHRQIRWHSESERTLLSIIGHQVGGAIENARLYEEATGRSLEISQLIAKGERAEQQLIQRAQLLDLASDAIVVVGEDDVITYWNNGAARLYGWSREEAVGRKLNELLQPLLPQSSEQVLQDLTLHQVWRGEVSHSRRDGARIIVDSRWTLHECEDAAAVYLQINTDVTDRKRLENQVLQSQKMEAIGRLTGGIAHDFNNLLTVIMGRTGLVLERATDVKMRGDLELVVKTASRAAELTHNLLAFSRRQALQPRVVDLNGVVSDIKKMLERIVGEDIRLVVRLEKELAAVRADATQLGQVLLNLVVNARDAMPQGGTIEISTRNLDPDASYCRQYGLTSRLYVVLEVRDEGIGITPEAQSKIFEPFFTTKGQGNGNSTGTGLGLSIVYGVVKQSDGSISVHSEIGKGTTFRVYLPQIGERIEFAAPSPDTRPGGQETILLVEDEQAVREFMRESLESKGYTVLDASRPTEAIRISDEYQGPIHLMITDIVMPELNGWSMAARIHRRRPDIKALYTSGYTQPEIPNGNSHSTDAFLPKPITVDGLHRKVREILQN